MQRSSSAGRAGRATGVTIALTAAACVAALALLPSDPSQARAEGFLGPSVSEQIGIDAVEQRLGADAPTGRGVVVAHVESKSAGGYKPMVDAGRFGGVTFRMMSGESAVSSHASGTASVIYGPSGHAPGVTDVDCYATTHWFRDGCLNVGKPAKPTPGRARVQTHSWIARPKGANASNNTLRRLDALIDEHDVVVVVGVDNGGKSTVPPMLASAHNVLAVGRLDGESSGGGTRVEGEGRSKPDIVAPARLTSTATPIVTAVVARLLETALSHESDAAAHAEVIKAVLLAGAERGDTWQAAKGRTLDDHLGAGLVRFDHSYSILSLAASPPDDDRLAGPVGWHFGRMPGGDAHAWQLDIEPGQTTVSVALTWHRRIENRVVENFVPGQAVYLDTPRVADFDLHLYRVSDDGQQLAASSASRHENVELVFERGMKPGRYRMVVTRRGNSGESWDYALAWRIAADADAAR